MSPFDNCQTIASSTPPLITYPCNLLSNPSTSLNSQSFICLVNTGFQQPASPTCFHIWSTQASLLVAIENNSGEVIAKGSSPHHISFQNLTFLPFPTLKPILLLNPFHPYRSSRTPTPSSSLYFPITTCFQKESFLEANLQYHFPRRALFRKNNFLTPRPPSFLSKPTIDQLTRWGLL